jgi:multimeric flavodoxin WrbA
MVVDQNEAHHLKRYENYPRVGLLVEQEPDTDVRDLQIIKDIFSRTALNLKSKLDFVETSEAPIDDLAQKIIYPRRGPHLYQKNPQLILGEQISPPKRITVFNGSPRGKKGNTPIMLEELLKGFGGEFEIHHLVQIKKLEEQVKAYHEAECVWLGFPLYTDAMPGLVKNFIEALEPFRDNENNPPMGFLVQSGFPEGIHSRYVERYLDGLAKRLGSPYLGTIIKGNGEGTRVMPTEATQSLFDNLQTLGKNLAETGKLNPEILETIAKPERYPRILGPVFRIFLKTKIAHSYFDGMMHENGAYERRNDQPLLN